MRWAPVAEDVSIRTGLLSRLIGHIGSTEFDRVLLEVTCQQAPVAETTGYLLIGNAAPMAAGWTGSRADAASRVEQYVHGGHRCDPVLGTLPARAEEGAVFVCRITPREVEDDEYRWQFFELPEFRSDISIALRTSLGWNIIKFFLEQDDASVETVRRLGEWGAVLFPIARRHSTRTESAVSQEARPMAEERLRSALKARFPELTEREREVCAQTLLGQSSGSIAAALELTTNTVMTYRRRAYKRLGVSNANQLLKDLF